MRRIGRRLTYANVMTTIGVVLLIGGATAFAAVQLGKNSVGAKQLKRNAVTAAKFKKNAVTRAKIKSGAVDGSKVADGSITGADIDAASTPFQRVVARFRQSGSLTVEAANKAFPLSGASYTQAADEVDTFVGTAQVFVPAACTQPRQVFVYVEADAKDPTAPTSSDLVAVGTLFDTGSGDLNTTLQLGPQGGGRFEPGAARSHTLSVVASGFCGTGSGSTLKSVAIDVIGTR